MAAPSLLCARLTGLRTLRPKVRLLLAFALHALVPEFPGSGHELCADCGDGSRRTSGESQNLRVIVRNGSAVPLVAEKAHVAAGLLGAHSHRPDQEIGEVELAGWRFH